MSSLGLVQPRATAAQQERSADEGHAREDQVHVERPAPGQVLGQRTAEQQADRAAGGGDGAVDAERLAALLRLGERRGQQRQRRRDQDRAERALAGPGDDQHGEVDRGAADGRDAGEAEQPGQERHLPAEQVGQPPAEQQQAAEGQGVGGHHPLPVHRGEMQRVLRGRQRDVHHRDVEDDHELREADDAEDEPPPPLRGSAGAAAVPAGGVDIRHELHQSGGVFSA